MHDILAEREVREGRLGGRREREAACLRWRW